MISLETVLSLFIERWNLTLIKFRRSSHQLSIALSLCHRNDLSLLSLTSSVMLFVTHPLGSPERACTREYRAFWGRWSFGCPTCDRTWCFRHDASLALQPIHSFSRDVAFPRWPIQAETRVGKDSASEWDHEGFLDRRDRDPAGNVRAL